MTRLLAALFLVVLAAPTYAQDGDPAPVDFAQLQRRGTPNEYLVCPTDVCRSAEPDRPAPTFDIPVAQLQERLVALLATLPRTRILVDCDAHLVVEQRSLIFRFPDYIDVRAIAIDASRSTIAIYSRSKIGFYDFGVNKRRVEGWLRKLE